MKARNMLLAALTFGAAVTPILHGEQAPAPNRVVRLSYMKVEPARATEYVQRLREHYKLIQQDRVARGQVISWKAYSVRYPNGESQEYNYVLAIEYPSLGHLEDLSYAESAKRIVGEEAYLHALANPIAKAMRTDTLMVRADTSGWVGAANPVLAVHYFRTFPGKAADYLALQRNHYLPLNEDRVREGGSISWAAAQLRFPEQRDHPYNHISFNGYQSMAHMDRLMPQPFRDRWQARSAEVAAQVETLRTRVKGELWRLVDQTSAAPVVATARGKVPGSPVIQPVAGALATAGEFKIPERTPIQKYNRLLYFNAASTAIGISHAKSRGISVDEYATFCGGRFAATWNKEAGFAGFARGMLANFDIWRQDEDPPVEILAQSESMVQFKAFLGHQRSFRNGLLLDVTVEELRRWYEITGELTAAYLGCTYAQQTVENEFLIVTLTNGASAHTPTRAAALP